MWLFPAQLHSASQALFPRPSHATSNSTSYCFLSLLRFLHSSLINYCDIICCLSSGFLHLSPVLYRPLGPVTVRTGQKMDSADPVRAAVSKQGAILGAHEQALQALDTRCQAIGETQAKILASLQETWDYSHQTYLSCPAGWARLTGSKDAEVIMVIITSSNG